jgi:hypothetical protein
VLGWLVSIVVSFAGAFLIAPIGGMVVAIGLSPYLDGARSLAAAGGPVMSIALAATMVVTMLGAWSAFWLVSRWR